jgi:pimeloyl-ACP methyl ester carboxylesterase
MQKIKRKSKTKGFGKSRFQLTIITALFIFFLFPFKGYTDEPFLKFQLTHGPYTVGFKAVNNYDYSRTFYSTYDKQGNKVTEKARPIQTSIWYPANSLKTKNAKRMGFVEYTELVAHHLGYKPLTEKVRQNALADFYRDVAAPAAKQIAPELVTQAVRDAEPAQGNFPLVVYGASLNSFSFENSELFEFLASHGYIIVSSPSIGYTTRYMKKDLINTESQARDILFLLAYMQDYPGVDRSKIALMGFSWGGMSAALAAMRDTRIGAFVSLDGSIGFTQFHVEIAKKSIYYNPDNITMPSLFMRSWKGPDAEPEKYNPDKKFDDALKYSDRYFLRFHHMLHLHFSSTFINFMKMSDIEHFKASRHQVNYSYNMMCKYVHSFLDAYLKGDNKALQYMANTPRENGIGDDVMAYRFQKKKKRTGQ